MLVVLNRHSGTDSRWLILVAMIIYSCMLWTIRKLPRFAQPKVHEQSLRLELEILLEIKREAGMVDLIPDVLSTETPLQASFKMERLSPISSAGHLAVSHTADVNRTQRCKTSRCWVSSLRGCPAYKWSHGDHPNNQQGETIRFRVSTWIPLSYARYGEFPLEGVLSLVPCNLVNWRAGGRLNQKGNA